LLLHARYPSPHPGFLQEIGPYYLEDGIDYKIGDNLTSNPYSWHRSSNLLFF
jgi:carboxypeptidase C (cathepsin A)